MPAYSRQLLLDQFAPPGTGENFRPDHRLKIAVLFTSQPATFAAMQWAAELSRGLNAQISLFDFQTVPHPLALDRPAVSARFAMFRLQAIADSSGVETTARIYLCRCPIEAIKSRLSLGSLIVIGCRKRWWPTWETALARKLQRAGYEVVLHKFS